MKTLDETSNAPELKKAFVAGVGAESGQGTVDVEKSRGQPW